MKSIPFEIHLTARDESIHLSAATLGLRTITVDLLKPSLMPLRSEHMTSHVEMFETYDECQTFVRNVIEKLEKDGVSLVRAKIEVPFLPEFLDKGIYIESHWETQDLILNRYPLSRSRHKPHKLLATAREYNKCAFHSHNETWKRKAVVEICLFDNYVSEDFDWFSEYPA